MTIFCKKLALLEFYATHFWSLCVHLLLDRVVISRSAVGWRQNNFCERGNCLIYKDILILWRILLLAILCGGWLRWRLERGVLTRSSYEKHALI